MIPVSLIIQVPWLFTANFLLLFEVKITLFSWILQLSSVLLSTSFSSTLNVTSPVVNTSFVSLFAVGVGVTVQESFAWIVSFSVSKRDITSVLLSVLL